MTIVFNFFTLNILISSTCMLEYWVDDELVYDDHDHQFFSLNLEYYFKWLLCIISTMPTFKEKFQMHSETKHSADISGQPAKTIQYTTAGKIKDG